MNEEIAQLGVQLIQLGQIVGVGGVGSTQITLHHGHAIGCEGSRFVRAYGRRVAHCLTGVQMTNQIIILKWHDI